MAGRTVFDHPEPPYVELKDLVKLEEENARLKKLLADRLRKENADLRKSSGLLELVTHRAEQL